MILDSRVLNAQSLLPKGYRIEAEHLAGHRRFLRGEISEDDVQGWRSYMESDSGLCVCAGQVQYLHPVLVNFPTNTDVMKVHVRFSGASRVGREHDVRHLVPEMSCSALIQSPREEKIEHFDEGVNERSVTVVCSAEFLTEGFGLDSQALPTEIVRFLDGATAAMYGIDVPLLLETRRAAERIFEEVSGASASALIVESRALELLARFVDQARLKNSSSVPPLHARDRHIADSARRVLEARFSDAPSLKELAREVGTHPAKLMRIFKAVHGRTIGDHLESLRMERARMLLEEGELPVTQIAYELGYEHPSNFATAFKRRFGVSPSAIRTSSRSNGY